MEALGRINDEAAIPEIAGKAINEGHILTAASFSSQFWVGRIVLCNLGSSFIKTLINPPVIYFITR